jgi:hypothetical protein
MPRTRPPFAERGGPVRGLLDLATGRYPAFLFGGAVSNLLPVFHLHHAEPSILEAQLTYLADNGYRTVTTDAIERVVLGRQRPDPRTVALCFDDCWASVWTVAGPLLRERQMTAIAFAIPARIRDAAACRPTISENRAAATSVDTSAMPFATWPELRELQRQGVLDIQSHTLSHSAVFSGSDVAGFVTPAFAARPLLDRPELSKGTWLSPESLGAPLYLERSRMSDALRFYDDAGIREQCMRHVAAHGGPEFFQRPPWRSELLAIASRGHGRSETGTDRRAAVEEEIVAARAILEDRLGASVPHVCMPWGIGGSETRAALKRTGQKLAFVDRLFGRRAVAAGDDPHSLMRLHERFIMCLPGRGRRHFFNAR